MTHTGGCLCGAVTYEVAGPLRDVIACHCSQCRKTSGHHVAATSAELATIAVAGAVTWYGSSAGAERGFCPVCGSNLFWREVDGDRMSIFAGTLDGATGLRTAGHIFAADKSDYYEINDDAPVFPGFDASMTNRT
ncbi:MAG: GFA family protein [Pseudomonadota bacterium]